MKSEKILHSSFFIPPARPLEPEPVEAVRAEGQEVGQLADGRKAGLAEQLDRHVVAEAVEVELDRLAEAREVVHDQEQLILVLADVREDPGISRVEELDRPASERAEALADVDQAADPVQQRGRRAK